MSIASKRILDYTNALVREAMKKGYLPKPSWVKSQAQKFAQERAMSDPSMELRLFDRRGQFDMEAFNLMVSEIVDDLNLAFGEQVDQANRLLRALNEADLKHASFQYQLETLEDLMDILLLMEPKAGGFFYSVGDTFADASKIDQTNSTVALDLSSGSIYLPELEGTWKIPMAHMARKTSVNLQSDDLSAVQRTELVGDSRFGFAFDDTIRAWQHRIVSTSPDGWAGSFQFPVLEETRDSLLTDEKPQTFEIYASRLDFEGANFKNTEVLFLYSVDGKNFTQLPGHSWKPFTGKKQSLFFERIKIEFLRLLIRTAEPVNPETPNNGTYDYIIGLKNLSLYDAGFASRGDLVSKELAPEGVTERIGKVLLDVDEDVPNGTDIEYYVSAYTDTPAWKRIEPSGRSGPGAVAMLDFSQSTLSPRKDNHIVITSSPTVNSIRNGITCYNIGTLNGEQVDDTARLYRGIGGWKQSHNVRREVVSVRNNYLVFTQNDDFQKLYVEVKDEAVSGFASDGSNDTSITVSRSVLDDESVSLTPAGSSPEENPAYSIRQVVLLPATATTGTDTITVSTAGNVRTVSMASADFAATTRPSTYIFITQGTVSEFFRINTVATPLGSDLTVYLDDPEHKLSTGSASWSQGAIYVTGDVTDINGNTFTLDSGRTVAANDVLLVTYRSPLEANERPLTSTIVVKENDGAFVYQAGRDYIVNPEERGVSRNPSGRISLASDSSIIVRVDFDYERLASEVDTYTTNLLYQGDGTAIELGAAISVDTAAGEGVFLDTGRGEVLDLSEVTTMDRLTKGYRRLTVRSTPILDDSGAVDTTCALYKVINALDNEGTLVFGPRHFAEKIGELPPAKSTTLFYMQTSMNRDDRSLFAIDGNNVVINYDPTTDSNFVYLRAGASSLQTKEVFEVQYRYQPSTVAAVNSLLFKAVLSRGDGLPRYQTPVLRSYHLRLAY